MPEGDTLYRIANSLRPVLAGRTIVDASAWERDSRPGSSQAVDAASLVGRTVEAVEAAGKHLLIRLDDARVLHSHLGMTGAWHAYPLGAEWAKPADRAALTLSTTDSVVVCFTPKQMQLVSEPKLRGDAYLRRLGPDLMLPETDPAACLPRLRTHDRTPIGEAVMNQTVVAGIGNVYKSESLFLAGIHPWRPVETLDDARLLAYLALTKKLMHQNRGRGWRTTRYTPSGPRLWVYGRANQACLKCGATIQMRRQGESGRSTYWCDGCQPASDHNEGCDDR